MFLSDPFPGFYDTQFLANLLWDDHSLSVELQQQIHYSDDALKGMDYLLDYSEGGFRVVKSPAPTGAK